MAFNIVLVEPEIPNNTGNIGRLSLASGCSLHLIKPLGFEITDKRVKRAGLDYWQHVNLRTYENIEDFLQLHSDKKLAFFSSKGTKSHWDLAYEKDLFLVFGKESVGLPEPLVQKNLEDTYKIPIHSPYIRSLNLANAVSIIVYHGLFQLQ
ncbi:MAG: tRNA (cytidine(34)-2'-O)-methyltransferase [Bacteroidota bacterium]